MLNRRVPILFEEKNYLMLAALAREESQSFGELVRRTMDEKLKLAAKKQTEERMKTWDELMAWRKKMKAKNKNKKPLTVQEIKDLVNYGRKY